MKSDVPVPLRLLDYYVGFKRQNPNRRVCQVLVVLKQIGEAIPDRYEDERTSHIYDVVKLWEEDSAELLKHEGLLPLATLCRAESGEKLLGEVAVQVNRIKSRERRREMMRVAGFTAQRRPRASSFKRNCFKFSPSQTGKPKEARIIWRTVRQSSTASFALAFVADCPG